MNTRHCPVFGCRRVIRHPAILCPQHWSQVPEHLRRRLWRLYYTEPGSNRHMELIVEILTGLDQQEMGAAPSSLITAKEAD